MSGLFEQSKNISSPPPFRKAIFLFPIIVILGILTLIGSSLDQLWGKAPEVEVARVRFGSSVQSSSGSSEVDFRAAGWLRAGPYPVLITALAGGIVKRVHVVEGERVKSGQLLVELDDEDARLDLKEASQKKDLAEAETKIREVRVKVMEGKLNELHLEKELQRVALEGLEKDHLRLSSSGPGISLRETEQALYRMKVKAVELKKLDQKEMTLKSEIDVAKRDLDFSKEEARLRQIGVEKAELNLRRMKIHSPQDGVLKEVHAREGRKQLLGADQPLSTTVATLFSTRNLYVRVDVPLMDAFKVRLGQKAKIEVEGRSEALLGEVTNLAGEADEQKNTLGVRVLVQDPPNELRPGMLAQVIFLGDGTEITTSSSSSLLLHPKALVEDRVAVVDAEGRLLWRKVRLQGGHEKGWLILLEGLSLGEKTVLEPLPHWTDGMKLAIGGGT